jgi:hypothetical protein
LFSQGSRFWTNLLGSCRWPRNAEGTPLLNALQRIPEPPSSQAFHVGFAPGEEEHQLNSSFSAARNKLAEACWWKMDSHALAQVAVFADSDIVSSESFNGNPTFFCTSSLPENKRRVLPYFCGALVSFSYQQATVHASLQ